MLQTQSWLFDRLQKLETLDLSHNDISSIGPRVFKKLSNLKTLDVSYNGINKLEYGLFDGLHKLVILKYKPQ